MKKFIRDKFRSTIFQYYAQPTDWKIIVKHNVLIADDESEIRNLLDDLFNQDFNLFFAETGDEVISHLQSSLDIIILDMHLPGKSGIDICQHVASLPLEQRPSIVVVSGDTSDALVKDAYELGISDYIGKPFNLVTFHERIIRFAHDINAIRELRKKDKEIESLAQTAMKQAASYGRALELVAKLNDCETPEDIMHCVAKSMHNQDLKIAIQLRSEQTVYSYDVDTNTCSPIELQIFDVLKNHGRIYHFGRRSIFNDTHVSILYKNMPYEGTLSFDAILDVAAKLILAVNSRFLSLVQQQSLISTRSRLKSVLGLVTEGIQSVERERRDLIEQVELKIGLSFHELDMTEEQEQFFVQLIETEIRSRGESTNLKHLKKLIVDCVDDMVLLQPSKNSNETSKSESIVDSVTSDDIELF